MMLLTVFRTFFIVGITLTFSEGRVCRLVSLTLHGRMMWTLEFEGSSECSRITLGGHSSVEFLPKKLILLEEPYEVLTAGKDVQKVLNKMRRRAVVSSSGLHSLTNDESSFGCPYKGLSPMKSSVDSSSLHATTNDAGHLTMSQQSFLSNVRDKTTQAAIVVDTTAGNSDEINQLASSQPGNDSKFLKEDATRFVTGHSHTSQSIGTTDAISQLVSNQQVTRLGRFSENITRFVTGHAHRNESSGYTNATGINVTEAERNPTTNQFTTGHSTHEPFSVKQDILNISTTHHAVQASETVSGIFTNYTTTTQGSDNRATTEYPVFTTTPFAPNTVYANSTKGQGYTNATGINVTEAERTPTTNQFTTGHSTHEPFSVKQDILNTSTTHHAVQASETVSGIFTNYTTTTQGSDNRATTEYPIFTTTPFAPNMDYANSTKGQAPCPPNMVYANCTEGQSTCHHPSSSTKTCSESMTCVCPAGFLVKVNDCVPQEECECYLDGFGVIPNGEYKVNSDCTSLCECHSDVLTCSNTYECSSAATCEERNGVRQCYCNDGYTGDGQNCEVEATDCADIYDAGNTNSGIYTIKPTHWPGSPYEVYCNMTDEGGWTVFQRRIDGSQNFHLRWNMYKDGFGLPDRELWLGNDKLYYMTDSKNYQLRIDLIDKDGSSYYARYEHFRISDENDEYRLVGLGAFSGTLGDDALNKHRNYPFSTYDRDNDGNVHYNCANEHRGGWWYGNINHYVNCPTSEAYCNYWETSTMRCVHCAYSNLNGDYSSSTRGTSIYWNGLPGYDCNIIYTEMKIIPI